MSKQAAGRSRHPGEPLKSTVVPPPVVPPPYMTSRTVLHLGLIALLAWIVGWGGRGMVLQVVNRYYWNLPEHPYFALPNAGLLYIVMPTVVLCMLILFTFPGLLTMLAWGATHRWPELFLRSFGVSLILYFFSTAVAKSTTSGPVAPTVFAGTLACVTFLAWGILAIRVVKGRARPWMLADAEDRRRLLWTILIPVVAVMALLPAVYWQDLNDDGFEALEIGRSLSTFITPRFPTPNGFTGIAQGMLPMAYPIHWFVTLLGPVEAAARLPMILYLPLLFCLLLALIEWQSPRRLQASEEALILLALAILTVTLSFSASYDPYFADIASPAALEVCTVCCILATLYFLQTAADRWFFFFALLSYLARPTGLLVLGFLGVSIFLTVPDRRKAWLARIAAAGVLCLVFGYVYDHFYIPWLIGDVKFSYPFSSILGRLQYLRFDDLRRLNFILFPSGIIPLLALLLFPWQDCLGRAATLLSLFYFGFFYVPAFVALHHFVPVMVLPLIVFWRLYLHRPEWPRRVVLAAVAAGGLLALFLSLPRQFEINRVVRHIGQRLDLRVGAYDSGNDADYRALLSRFLLLFTLIPPDWEVPDAGTELVSSHGSVIYYGSRPKPPGTEINYIIQPLTEKAPSDFKRVAADEVAAIYIKDLAKWKSDRLRPLETNFGSALYHIPRNVLFKHWGVQQGKYQIDLGRK